MDGDIDYGALFGVAGQGEGEESAEVQDPGQDSAGAEREVSGSPAQEQPVQEGPAEPDADSQEPEAGQADREAGADRPLPAREEQGAGIAGTQEAAQRAIDEFFAHSGLRNPYTGQPITTKAEYEAYRERYAAERREQVLKKSGMSSEEFEQFIRDLPEVRQAQEAQRSAEQAIHAAREAAARAKVDEQLKEIGALDPSVKSLEDLTKMPTYPRFYELVQRGNTLTDAFKLANYDTLTQSAAAGARQAAVNAARGKGHLEQTRSRGTGAVSVPADVREQYRFFNPDATDEEIQRHYQKNHREGS